MLKVHLVFVSFRETGDGLCGAYTYTKPEIIAAFTTPEKSRKWVRDERKKHNRGSNWRFTHKILKVS
jgi:hypothetical protein